MTASAERPAPDADANTGTEARWTVDDVRVYARKDDVEMNLPGEMWLPISPPADARQLAYALLAAADFAESRDR